MRQVKEDEMVNDEMVNIEDFAANQQESDIQAGESADSIKYSLHKRHRFCINDTKITVQTTFSI
mgnify:CR=1 FL=1